MHGLDTIEDLVGPVGKVFHDPVLKDTADSTIETDHYIVDSAGAILGAGLDDVVELTVIDGRYHRGGIDADRYTSIAERAQSAEDVSSRGSARLHDAFEVFVQCGEAEHYMDEVVCSEFGEYVDVALYHSVLCNDTNGMAVLIEYLKQLPCNAELPFAGLIAVSIAGHEHRFAGPFGIAEILPEQCRRCFLDKDILLEVLAGTKVPILMRVARIAIDTAMLAALIGIEAIHAAQVRALNLVDQSLWKDLEEFSLGVMEQGFFALLFGSEIIEIGDERVFDEAVVGVGLRTAAPDVYFFIFIVHTLLFLKSDV